MTLKIPASSLFPHSRYIVSYSHSEKIGNIRFRADGTALTIPAAVSWKSGSFRCRTLSIFPCWAVRLQRHLRLRCSLPTVSAAARLLFFVCTPVPLLKASLKRFQPPPERSRFLTPRKLHHRINGFGYSSSNTVCARPKRPPSGLSSPFDRPMASRAIGSQLIGSFSSRRSFSGSNPSIGAVL